MLTDADIKRLQSYVPDKAPPDDASAPQTARPVRRDRVFDAMSEKERFEGCGVDYDQEPKP